MKRLIRRLFLYFWRDEIVDAHLYMHQKKLQAIRNKGARQDYPLREAGGAQEVLWRLGLLDTKEKVK
jgi:hypothetical protein